MELLRIVGQKTVWLVWVRGDNPQKRGYRVSYFPKRKLALRAIARINAGRPPARYQQRLTDILLRLEQT